MQFRDLDDDNDWDVDDMVVAAIRPEDVVEHPSDVTLPDKYADYADVFDKAEANKLPPHSTHDLAIEMIDDRKLPPFGPVYDQSKLELDVTREYVYDMLKNFYS